MRIDFKRIEIHSFMSFEDETFDFSEHSGMVLVTGKNNDIPGLKNGSGKTSLFSALLYVLFGQLQGKIKNENVVNRYAEDKDMRISLLFSVDGTEYTVVRGLNKGKLSYLELKRGDEDITKSTIAETQEFIEKELIMCDVSIFMRTMMLSSDQTYNFYMLKKSDKKDFVEKLFDISVFGSMYDAIHKDVLLLDRDIVSRQNRLAILNRSDTEYKDKIDEYACNKTAEIKRISAELAELKTRYEGEKAKNQATHDEETRKLESAAKKISDAENGLADSIRSAESTIYKFESAVSRLQSTKEARQSVIDKHSDLMSKLCDDCRVTFGDYYKIGEYKAEIAGIDEKVKTIESKKDEELQTVEESRKKLAEFKDKRRLVESKVRQLNESIISANRALNALESKIAMAESNMKRLETEQNPYIGLYEKNKKTIDDEMKALDAKASEYKYLKFAEDIVSQDTLRKFIISDLIGLLNNRIRRYLTKLGSAYTVEFDSDMDYEFITSGGKCEFQNFSAGERMRIMIATSFAFRDFMSIRNGLNSNILILDEYFDSAIDSTCVDSILGILREYIGDFKQNIYVISHRSEVSQDQFSGIIQVEKTNDISRINILK